MRNPVESPVSRSDRRQMARRTQFWVAIICALCLFSFALQASAAGDLHGEAGSKRAAAAAKSESAPGAALASTPDLIEQSYLNGAISAEQRLLYLAYAVYEPARLPPEYQSSAPWSGTNAVSELTEAISQGSISASDSLSSAAQAELNRVMRSDAATVCDRADGASNFQSANFRLNFGAIAGGLNAQSYADSLEDAFGVVVTKYGWAKPPYCTASSDCAAANPWGRYPVQVAPLSGGLYGYVTSGGGRYTGRVGDNPNTDAVETAASASCMVLNSDYSGFPGGAQYALDATTAHEYAHSIQFGYGDPGSHEDAMWYESGAAYVEDEVQDDINDNYQYLWPAFARCLGEYKPSPGTPSVYSNWLFFRFAAEKLGGTNKAGGGEEVMQKYLANVAAGQSALRAYDNALRAKGSNLRNLFHDYASASAVVNACPIAGANCFEEAQGYVGAAGAIAPHGQISAIGGQYQGTLANHFAANWVSLPSSGAYSLELENLSSQGQLRVTIVAVANGSLAAKPFPEIVGANQRVFIPAYKTPAATTSVMAVITNQQWTSDDPTTCATSAYRLRIGTARPLAIDVRAPGGQTAARSKQVKYPFRVSNGGLNSGIFALQVTSSLGWANTASVPTTVTIAAGATRVITIPVTVPGSAQAGDVEETKLAAASVSNAAVNDAATVKTTLADGQVYLPYIASFEPPPPPPNTFTAVGDTTVMQGYPGENICSTGDMWAGYDEALDPDGKIVRSLIKFDLTAVPAGTPIVGATLHLYHLDSWDYPNRTRTITAYGIASGWNTCAVTWSTQPALGGAYGSRDLPWSGQQWYTFDVTALVRGWLNGSIPNFGIAMRGPENSGDDSSWRSFATANSGFKPFITIDYVGTAENSVVAGLPRVLEETEAAEPQSVADLLSGEPLNRFGCAIGDNVMQRCLFSIAGN